MPTSLPIDALLNDLKHTVSQSSTVILSAEPGAGKTTRVPVALSEILQGQILVLEPRRIAAIAAAHRIAEENGWVLGQEVGYHVRFDLCATPETKILFLTEALLFRRLLSQPDLAGVHCVILDEFHERSIHVDMALAALKELQMLNRPDLKIVIMSATLNATPLSDYFGGAPLVHSQGKTYPLHINYSDKAFVLNTGFEFIERIKKMIISAHNAISQGDILCFLPGRGEIERVSKELEPLFKDKALIVPLHGQLDIHDQKKALLPSRFMRKIILATNIAESSLTVSGVRVVVDSGLERIQTLNSKTGFESLQLSKISKASAKQRAGRAAREGEGFVYRGWSVHDERAMDEFTKAEIHRIDLSESLLLLSALGITSYKHFSWFESPSDHALQRSVDFLKKIGALEEDGKISSLGKRLRFMPLHPRLAKLLIEGERLSMPVLACELAIILSERNLLLQKINYSFENDLMGALEEWRSNFRQERYKYWNRIKEQWLKLLNSQQDCGPYNDESLEQLLFNTFPDRVCRRRRKDAAEAKMVGGRGVKLHPQSTVKTSEYFLALEISDGEDASVSKVFRAMGLSQQFVTQYILPYSKKDKKIEWDEEQKKFWEIDYTSWDGLPIGSESRRPASKDSIHSALTVLAYDRWEELVEKNMRFSSWLSRLDFLHKYYPQYPVLSEEQKKQGLELACYGEDTLKSLEEKDLIFYFQQMLKADQLQILERECPYDWQAPTGNRFKIDYSTEQGPSVEVRLQEVFGLARNPMICNIPLTFILLAPNYRPTQVTKDIMSFWNNAYIDVRKELRSRYPKHSWPEDPLSAPPQSKGRSKK